MAELIVKLDADTQDLEAALDRAISKFRALTVAANEARDAIAGIPSDGLLTAKLNSEMADGHKLNL